MMGSESFGDLSRALGVFQQWALDATAFELQRVNCLVVGRKNTFGVFVLLKMFGVRGDDCTFFLMVMMTTVMMVTRRRMMVMVMMTIIIIMMIMIMIIIMMKMIMMMIMLKHLRVLMIYLDP